LAHNEVVLFINYSCKYDFLEIYEEEKIELGKNIVILGNNTSAQTKKQEKVCGDWSKKLKLLRYISSAHSSLLIKFESDFSHHFSGFKAQAWIEKGNAWFCLL